MNLMPITPDMLRRLSGKTEADDLRSELAGHVLRIPEARRSLTNEKGAFYGQTFWMVVAAEKLIDAEASADAIRARLDAMDEHYGRAQQENTLRWHGFLPPLSPGEAAQRVQDIMRGAQRCSA